MTNKGEAAIGSYSKGEGIYLFCIARPPLPKLKDLAFNEQCPSSQQVFKDVVAVFCKVPLADFCGPSAESKLQDPAWVAPRAYRHGEVVQEVLRHSPVLPVGFGTIFSSPQRLEGLLEKHYETITHFLDEVEDKEEWSVKGMLDRKKAKQVFVSKAVTKDVEDLSSLTPGIRYFQEKRAGAAAEEKLRHWLRETSQDIWNDLNRYCSDFCERKVFPLSAEKGNLDVVLNWAFLVTRGAEGDFRVQVDDVNAGYEKDGLTFQLTGPWPPYSFCPRLEME
ncbi:MAG: GvpL/GvpF family gas vesicle protein [Deltaproteobacteria bacterium]|nr:GvpL/GvpF family gas vesicle protein [Deltaproteobacteria bacterium]